MSDDTLRKPHITVSILRAVPVATAEGPTALALETQELGTIFVQMPPAAIPIVQDALNQLALIVAQGTGTA